MWELACKESWAPKNWCFWTMVLEKTLEIPLYCKEIKPVSPKENQPWIVIWRTDAEAKAPVVWPPDGKSQLIVEDLDTGKDWRQEKGMTEDEIVGMHHWLNGYGFKQTLGDGKDREAWSAAVLVVAKNWTWLSNWKTTILWLWMDSIKNACTCVIG